jgi:hypothetical protein
MEFPVTADAALAFLADGAGRWRTVFELPEAELAKIGRSRYPHGLDPQLPLLDILWWVNRELIHHGAEIAMLRDLYAWRPGSIR